MRYEAHNKLKIALLLPVDALLESHAIAEKFYDRDRILRQMSQLKLVSDCEVYFYGSENSVVGDLDEIPEKSLGEPVTCETGAPDAAIGATEVEQRAVDLLGVDDTFVMVIYPDMDEGSIRKSFATELAKAGRELSYLALSVAFSNARPAAVAAIGRASVMAGPTPSGGTSGSTRGTSSAGSSSPGSSGANTSGANSSGADGSGASGDPPAWLPYALAISVSTLIGGSVLLVRDRSRRAAGAAVVSPHALSTPPASGAAPLPPGSPPTGPLPGAGPPWVGPAPAPTPAPGVSTVDPTIVDPELVAAPFPPPPVFDTEPTDPVLGATLAAQAEADAAAILTPAPSAPGNPSFDDPSLTDTASRLALASGYVDADDTPAPVSMDDEGIDIDETLSEEVWDEDWDWDLWDPIDEVEALPEHGRIVRFSIKEDGLMSEKQDAMRVAPREVGGGMVWGVELNDVGEIEGADLSGDEQTNLVAMALWLERRPEHGEDAQPSFLFDIATGTGLVATYDGTGGSGSAPVRTLNSGRELTGAYVASRVARKGTESWFAWVLDNPEDGRPPDEQLHAELKRRLEVELQQGLKASGKFAGSLRRDLPTTIAGSAFIASRDRLTIASLWAGDSRCYVLSPDLGLQQLTVDDTPTRDALEAIVTDAPMSNLVCADRPFVINRGMVEVRLPAIVLSATDGCFGYVATPAHFEYLLLKHLMAAPDVHTWAEGVLDDLDGFTSDDASLALVAFGWPTYADLQAAFATREKVLRANHWDPFAGIDPSDREAFTAARLASWRRYKQLYEEYLPYDPEPTAASEHLAPPAGYLDPAAADDSEPGP